MIAMIDNYYGCTRAVVALQPRRDRREALPQPLDRAEGASSCGGGLLSRDGPLDRAVGDDRLAVHPDHPGSTGLPRNWTLSNLVAIVVRTSHSR